MMMMKMMKTMTMITLMRILTMITIRWECWFPENDDDEDDDEDGDEDNDEDDDENNDEDDDEDADDEEPGGRAGEGDDKPGLGGRESSACQGQCHFQWGFLVFLFICHLFVIVNEVF